MSTDSYQEALIVAKEKGHTLADDPPSIPSTVSRQTCTKCGAAVLGNKRNAYGSAIALKCPTRIESDLP